MATHRGERSAKAPDDPNILAAGLLYDMAALTSGERSRFGYKRAAKAIAALPASVSDLVESGALRGVPFIGPATVRILTEFVAEGRSPTVEAAVAASSQRSDLAKRRLLRGNFLSQHAMERAMAMRMPRGIVSRASFRGDFQMHSTWSDGAESVASMVEACLALGQSCMGITDHSHGLPIARGMSMEHRDAAAAGDRRAQRVVCRALSRLQRRRGEHSR